MSSHKRSGTRLYNIWNGMKQRCRDKNHIKYKNYGARGIRVCDDWLHDFMNFYNWAINNGYKENLTIDRIDVNGNYEPSNCQWLTNFEQQHNKTNLIILEYDGKSLCISEWARLLNIPETTLRSRHRRGWPDNECLMGRCCQVVVMGV